MRSYGALYLVEMMGIGFSTKMVLKRGVVLLDYLDIGGFVLSCYICSLIMDKYRGVLGFGICGLMGCVHLLGFLLMRKNRLLNVFKDVGSDK